MAISHTNHKGVTYYLGRSTTKTGKPRYAFAREPKGEPVDTIPNGFRISESVNGIVSLERDVPSQIHPEELATVEEALRCHPKPKNYRAAVKKNMIEVYERAGPDPDELAPRFATLFPSDIGLSERLREELDSHVHFSPVLRFIVQDAEQRVFSIQRWCYLGSIDDWIEIGQAGAIATVVSQAIWRLGDDAFYDPYWGRD